MVRLIPCKKRQGEFQLAMNNGILLRGIPYNIEEEEIKNLIIPKSIENNNEWNFTEHSKENLERITPHTQKNKNLKILLIIKKILTDGIIIKAVLKNLENNKFSLITSMNKQFALNYKHRKMKSLDNDWSICRAHMQAPQIFWNELKNRIQF